MPFDEHALQFSCDDAALIGILSRPRQAATRGVLVVVGGPQYRAGSHRQFTLLARALAAQGIPVLRFDYRGMGDSEGAARDFEAVSADLRAAIDEFFRQVPTLRDVVLWGCATAPAPPCSTPPATRAWPAWRCSTPGCAAAPATPAPRCATTIWRGCARASSGASCWAAASTCAPPPPRCASCCRPAAPARRPRRAPPAWPCPATRR
ncbi:serine aminopeptidase domain-containing protein [Rugamonas sp. DEMB1]|uniref:serine aminopeptidase domain-containing protein n=1 Tax=Rugamonas sp. DEMB1 TaxID=3039386 RepID=UPI0028BF4E28|nr:alpha/beta hydrolase [Rugamonas sp. DEMB1]